MNTIELLKEEFGELVESIKRAAEQEQCLNACICFLKSRSALTGYSTPYRRKSAQGDIPEEFIGTGYEATLKGGGNALKTDGANP